MKQLPQTVELSEEFLRRIVASSPDCIKVLDLDGNLLAMNEGGQTVLEIVDVTPHLGTCWTGWWEGGAHHEDARRAVETAQRGGTGRFEGFAETFGGTPKWWDVTVSPIPGSDGRPEKLLSVSRDITASKQAAIQVAESERQLRTLAEQRRLALDSARMGWWHVDVPSGELRMDERFLAIFDVDQQTDAYAHVLERIHPEDRAWVDAAVQAAVRPVDPVPYAVEYRVVHRDGSLHWVAAQGQTYYEGEGSERRALSFSGTMADITEEKRAHEQLAQLAEQRRLALDSAQLGWYHYDPVAGTVDWDERAQSLYGVAEKQVAYERFLATIHPDDLAARNAAFQAVLLSEKLDALYQAEYRVKAADGAWRWLQVRGKPTFAREGAARRVRSMNCTVADVTAAKAAREALLESEARARQLADSERAARTEVERTSRMKDEFLATLSHELRTPLNAIVGWTHLLRNPRVKDEDKAEGLTVIERNAHAQTQIIEDLLDMSKIISGKVRLDVQPLRLDEVVAASVETMRPAAAAKGVRLQALVEPQARTISGDPNRLQQVFWNLLSNAIKFTPKGGKVQAVLEQVDSHLEVRVTDTGAGITPEFLPYVFDRFRQQDASTTRQHGGLGLGLAIVKQLVELHGGSITAKSAGPGQGTTFCVALPLPAVQPGSEPTAEVERRHPEAEATSLSMPPELLGLTGVKVLVVDDEPDARTLVRRFLEERQATVHTAGSAAEAFTLLQAERPDVLVSDIGMPQEDGYALIRRVRALPAEAGGQTPAVALTAYARAEDRLKAMVAGFQVHVSKPVNAVELLTLVATLTGRIQKSLEMPAG